MLLLGVAVQNSSPERGIPRNEGRGESFFSPFNTSVIPHDCGIRVSPDPVQLDFAAAFVKLIT